MTIPRTGSLVCGTSPKNFFRSYAYTGTRLPGKLAFGPPTSTISKQEAYIERVDHARTEIHHGSEGIVALVDVAAAHPLDGAFLRRVDLDLGQPLPLIGASPRR
jgi:hypothetical protein